jgi:hypothetical protein
MYFAVKSALIPSFSDNFVVILSLLIVKDVWYGEGRVELPRRAFLAPLTAKMIGLLRLRGGFFV